MQRDELKKAAIDATHAGDISTARSLWLRLCEVEPKENENWLLLSNIDARLGFLAAARNHLDFPLKQNKFDRDIWQLAATQSFELGRFEEATRLMHRVLQVDFTDIAIRRVLGGWCMRLGKWQVAICHFSYCLYQQPDDETVFAELLYCLMANDKSTDIQPALSFLELFGEDKVSDQVCHKAADLWLNLQSPANTSADDFPQIPGAASISQRLSNAIKNSKQSARTFYAKTAHVRAHSSDDSQEAFAKQLAKLCLPSEKDLCSIIELGASVGKLGTGLSKVDSQASYIIGVCLVSEELAYLSQNTAYDLVITLEDLVDQMPSISCDVLLINEQAVRLLGDVELSTLVNNISSKAVLAINDSKGLPQTLLREHLVHKVSEAKTMQIVANVALGERIADPLTTAALTKSEIETVIQAMQALRSGQYDRLVKLVEKIPANLDKYASVHFLRGVAAQHKKQYKLAAGHLVRCLRSDPSNVDARFQLATVWSSLGKEDAMHRAYHRVLVDSPEHTLAAQNLISHHSQLADFDKVGLFLRQLLLKHPIDKQIRKYAADIVADSGKQDFKIWLQQFYQQEAFLRAAFEASLTNKFFSRAAHILKYLQSTISANEGELLTVSLAEKSGKFSEALALMDQRVDNDPKDLGARTRRRSILMAMGQQEAALESWKYEITRFDGYDGNFSGALFVGNYFADLTPQELADHHKKWGQKVEEKDAEAGIAQNLTTLKPIDSKRKKIRIGYLSGDFKTHSVSLFLYNLYLHHNRDEFEIVSYSTNRSKDIWALKYELLSDLWREVGGLNTLQLVNRIRRDELDILVDLSGHTGHHRLRSMALRCAPLQGTYLGYANTTGLSAVDFRLSDEVADPRDQALQLHTEQIEHIAGGFLSYRREFTSPPVSVMQTESEQNERHYNYVCCNNVFKITPSAIALFAEILLRHEGAVMLIKAHNLDNVDLRNDLHSRFERHGVNPERVHLMNALDLDDHQALYNHTDVALDPFPYNGTTTSCDTMWMGVPMITLRGDRHSARVGASILTTIGREEWIAETPEEYVEKAVQLGKDKQRLLKEKIELRPDMLKSPLMLPCHTVGEIERIYSKLVKALTNNG